MEAMLAAQDYLTKYGIKISVQRIAIVEYLMKHRTHPTADEIYHALAVQIPTLSKTTVYNTLKLFAEQGAVLVLGIDDKNIRFDIDISDHAHFMCLGCGKLYDIPVEHLDQLTVSGNEAVKITEMHIYYKGYCKGCLNRHLSDLDKN